MGHLEPLGAQVRGESKARAEPWATWDQRAPSAHLELPVTPALLASPERTGRTPM